VRYRVTLPVYQRLPLFPLNVVLFPDALLPLHIFEERYKTLVRESVTDENEFGINYFDSPKIHSEGCSARVQEILKRYEDGKMDIVVEGKRRYTIHNIEDSVAGYQVGDVSYFDDAQETLNDALRMRAIALYNRFIEIVFKKSLEPVAEGNLKPQLSFLLVQKSGLSLAQRQNFLTLRSENERLEILVQHLESVLPIVASQQKIEAFVMNDGYLPQR
jgi:Lon protease-like protein